MARELIGRLVHQVALEIDRDVERALVHGVVVERLVRLHVLGLDADLPPLVDHVDARRREQVRDLCG